MKENFKKSEIFRKKIHNLIPGGCHTYSKGDDQFPELSPAAISHGKGAYLWDIDDNKYLDCTMGLASISLGHSYDAVNEKAKAEIDKGLNFQRASYIELDMAEAFLSLIPHHDMIKYAKNGSTLTTAAVKLARAFTGRDLVAFPYDHPFYSYDDWFIGKTNCSFGVPKAIQELSVTFKACDIESLKRLFEKYPKQISCIITEPEKNTCNETCECGGHPDVFLKQAIELCHENGALFILDEMQSGFRLDFPGAISKYNIKPDLTTWGKGIANGFSFSALTGTSEVMSFGGILKEGAEKTFLVSTTHGAETTSLAAGLKTIEIFKKDNVIEYNHRIGAYFIETLSKVVQDNNLQNYITVLKCNWMPGFQFRDEKMEMSNAYKTLVMQEMIKRGVLFQGIFIPCFSHTKEDVDIIAKAFNEALKIYNQALEFGITNYLVGNPIKPVFRKYN
jgi:glutamate-1-semialdehyde aminotransferase